MAVALVHRRISGEAIEITLALRIPHPDAFVARQNHTERLLGAEARFRRDEIRDRWILAVVGFVHRPHENFFPSWSVRARGVHASGEGFVRLQVATVRWSFTLFEARSINFVTTVYSESMHVDCRLASSQLLGSRRATWPRKRRRQRRRRRQPRKRSSRSTKPLSIRIASEVRYALCCTDRPQLSPTEYPRNKQSGRTIMQMAAA